MRHSKFGRPSGSGLGCADGLLRAVSWPDPSGRSGVHDRYEYREEKARAFEALTSLVERIVHPQANVVAMRGGSDA